MTSSGVVLKQLMINLMTRGLWEAWRVLLEEIHKFWEWNSICWKFGEWFEHFQSLRRTNLENLLWVLRAILNTWTKKEQNRTRNLKQGPKSIRRKMEGGLPLLGNHSQPTITIEGCFHRGDCGMQTMVDTRPIWVIIFFNCFSIRVTLVDCAHDLQNDLSTI